MSAPTHQNGREKPRCGETRTDGNPCRNPAVAGVGICVYHIRERAKLLHLSGGVDPDAGDPGES